MTGIRNVKPAVRNEANRRDGPAGSLAIYQSLELIQEEVVAPVVAFAFEQGIGEVLVEVRRIGHPGWGWLEVAAGLGPALVVGSVAVGVVIVRVMVHAVDVVSLDSLITAEKHPQAENAGQKQRRAASEHD